MMLKLAEIALSITSLVSIIIYKQCLSRGQFFLNFFFSESKELIFSNIGYDGIPPYSSVTQPMDTVVSLITYSQV